MPVDVAMRLYISHSPPLCSFLSSYEDLCHRSCFNGPSLQQPQQQLHGLQQVKRRGSCPQPQQQLYKPLRPCLSSGTASTSQRPLVEPPCLGWERQGNNKKRVVFADAKGMSLTAVHLFSKYDEEELPGRVGAAGRRWSYDGGAALQFDLSHLEEPAAGADPRAGPAQSPVLALDFQQPASDYLDFRSRLLKNQVCLENCSLQGRSLSGTVKVRNLGFKKEVLVRATFNSWAGHVDVACTYMNDVYGCRDNDTFAFTLPLPGHVVPWERAEFCVCFRCGGQTHWDNNDGQNYRLKHVGVHGQDMLHAPLATVVGGRPSLHRSGGGVQSAEMDSDQFGSPRTSCGLYPEWQSWGVTEIGAPYW